LVAVQRWAVDSTVAGKRENSDMKKGLSRKIIPFFERILVGTRGFEPPTPDTP